MEMALRKPRQLKQQIEIMATVDTAFNERRHIAIKPGSTIATARWSPGRL
jgi:hypothetical protein